MAAEVRSRRPWHSVAARATAAAAVAVTPGLAIVVPTPAAADSDCPGSGYASSANYDVLIKGDNHPALGGVLGGGRHTDWANFRSLSMSRQGGDDTTNYYGLFAYNENAQQTWGAYTFGSGGHDFSPTIEETAQIHNGSPYNSWFNFKRSC